MIRRILALFIVSLSGISSCAADLITNIEFGDNAVWSTTVTTFGTRIPDDAGNSGVIGTNNDFIIVRDNYNDRVSSSDPLGGAFGGVHVLVELVGNISTVGFQDVTLQFDVRRASEMEFVGATLPGDGSPDGDGILIESAAGISFDGTASNMDADFVDALQVAADASSSQIWNAAFAADASFGANAQDLSFDSSVDNSVAGITDLSFQFQINSPSERWLVTGFSLHGDPFVATATVPEPHTTSSLGLGLTFGVWVRRRRSKIRYWPGA